MMLSPTQRARYAQQLLLPGFGIAGQRQLGKAHITIIGVGGLGASAALYLAAAGAGTLQLIDPDTLERSNLHRQVLYRDSQVGRSKVECALEELKRLNPEINVITNKKRLNIENSKEILNSSQLVIDGSDNIATRWVLNQTCGELGLPWIYGAAEGLSGQLSVFWPHRGSPCYACLYPQQDAEESGGCVVNGVLGMVPGIIGQLQALEAIKLITGLGEPLLGCLLSYRAAEQDFRRHRLRADPECACAQWHAK